MKRAVLPPPTLTKGNLNYAQFPNEIKTITTVLLKVVQRTRIQTAPGVHGTFGGKFEKTQSTRYTGKFSPSGGRGKRRKRKRKKRKKKERKERKKKIFSIMNVKN